MLDIVNDIAIRLKEDPQFGEIDFIKNSLRGVHTALQQIAKGYSIQQQKYSNISDQYSTNVDKKDKNIYVTAGLENFYGYHNLNNLPSIVNFVRKCEEIDRGKMMYQIALSSEKQRPLIGCEYRVKDKDESPEETIRKDNIYYNDLVCVVRGCFNITSPIFSGGEEMLINKNNIYGMYEIILPEYIDHHNDDYYDKLRFYLTKYNSFAVKVDNIKRLEAKCDPITGVLYRPISLTMLPLYKDESKNILNAIHTSTEELKKTIVANPNTINNTYNVEMMSGNIINTQGNANNISSNNIQNQQKIDKLRKWIKQNKPHVDEITKTYAKRCVDAILEENSYIKPTMIVNSIVKEVYDDITVKKKCVDTIRENRWCLK